jgi:hypothetical protein
VAVGWYDAVQWARLKQVAVDAANLDDSFEAWKRNAEGFERELRRKGIEIQRVHIDVDSLIAWCRSRNKAIDGEARSEYAAHLAAGDKPS